MVSRNLTEVFVLMRNNAIHSRQIFSEHRSDGGGDERVRLMRSNSQELDVEASIEHRQEDSAPPPWIDALEEAHYIITRLRTKLSELEARHEKQITRPSLDDSSEKQLIEKLASEIGRLFTHAFTHVSTIKAQMRHGNKTEQKVTSNVVLALVTTLQDLTITFRTAQSNYLKSLTSREERNNAYFDLPNFEELSLDDNDLLPGLTSNQTDLLFSLPSTSGTQKGYMEEPETADEMFQRQALNQKQMLLIEQENINIVAEREQEVNKIVRSIIDLNDIFKDLSHMVHEQGTVLDRIDYNIEQSQYQVQEGYKQLQKAERYKRKNRKMHCILFFAASVIVSIILLIIVKS